jgi:K+ potassium transporter
MEHPCAPARACPEQACKTTSDWFCCHIIIMTQNDLPTPARRDDTPPGALDAGELDIADYLRDEPEEVVVLPRRQTFSGLVIGAVGVVYGDIGTSPIYAFREALHPCWACCRC